jgi:hypothetical protein
MVFDLSCGASFGGARQDLWDMFGGVHLILTIGILTGDTAIVSDRGLWFAKQYTADPNSSVVDGWFTTITKINTGSGCPGPYASWLDGGINGCGAHVAMSTGATESTKSSTSGMRLKRRSATTKLQDRWVLACRIRMAAVVKAPRRSPALGKVARAA